MKNFIIGTAGHIDHGKTSFIKYLTGKDTDSLPEEKRRGITIDLGFSYFNIDDLKVGVVDVPGHEKFIKNMVAGSTSVNFVLFFIALDDGIMPQTLEHFHTLNFLDIQNGLIILTKKDKADEARIREMESEVRDLIKNSNMKDFNIITTSINDEVSMENAKEILNQKIRDLTKNNTKDEAQLNLKPCKKNTYNSNDDFLMYIDRVFTVKGQGSIVTGSVISGEISTKDEVFIYPDKIKARIKSLENHGESIETGYTHNRLAINLGSFDKTYLKRGSFLSSNKDTISSNILHILVSPMPSIKLKSREKIKFYLGSAEYVGDLQVFKEEILIDDKIYKLGQIMVDSPLYSFYNQLGIIRSITPVKTLGGLKIINPLAHKIDRKSKSFFMDLDNLKNLAINRTSFEEDKIPRLEKNDLKIKLTKEEKVMKEIIFKFYKNAGFLTTKYEIIKRSLNLSNSDEDNFDKVHKYMVDNEMIVYLGEGIYILRGYIKESQKLILELTQNQAEFSLSDFRAMTNLDRKISLLLLKYLEKIKFLNNKDNIRYINKFYA